MPNAATATPLSLVDVGGVKYLQIRIPRRIDHPAALVVEVSADLVHWNSGAAHTAVVEDSAAAFVWVHNNIAQYGGDPQHVVLWGHSAGASHVADYVSHTGLQGAEAASVKGANCRSPALERW